MSYQTDKGYQGQSPAPTYQQLPVPVQPPPQQYQQYQQYPNPQFQQQQYQQYPPAQVTSPQPIAQPQMEQKGQPVQNYGTQPGEWNHGMCDCFGDCSKCCLTFWCPCVTYGRIQHRLRHNDMRQYSSCNGSCWGFCALMCCGLQWIMSMMQRGEVRHAYGLRGSGCGDCARHYCCECCALIQEDREVEIRKSLLVPANSTGYQQQGTLTYPQ